MLADVQLFEISFISTQALAQHAKHERYRKQHMYPGGNQNLSHSAFQNARRLVRHEELWCISYLFLPCSSVQEKAYSWPTTSYVCLSLCLPLRGQAQPLHASCGMDFLLVHPLKK